MKITEIINDLKRLNSYLPKDPQKNYANPLDRMARELYLIREFALQGDQKYVTAMLELNRSPLPHRTSDKHNYQELKMTKLQEMRKKRGIRPAELARRLKVSPSSICITEKKGIRNAGAAERYAVVLRCRPEDLMEFSTRIRPASAAQGAIDGICENVKCKCVIDGTCENVKCKVLSESTGRE